MTLCTPLDWPPSASAATSYRSPRRLGWVQTTVQTTHETTRETTAGPAARCEASALPATPDRPLPGRSRPSSEVLQLQRLACVEIASAPEVPTVRRQRGLRGGRPGDGDLDRPAGAGQRAVDLTAVAQAAIGKEFGGVLLRHVVRLQRRPNGQQTGGQEVPNTELPLVSADSRLRRPRTGLADRPAPIWGRRCRGGRGEVIDLLGGDHRRRA